MVVTRKTHYNSIKLKCSRAIGTGRNITLDGHEKRAPQNNSTRQSVRRVREVPPEKQVTTLQDLSCSSVWKARLNAFKSATKVHSCKGAVFHGSCTTPILLR